MVSNEAIDLMPADSLWPGSEKILWNCMPPGDDSVFPIRILLCAALFLLIAVSRHFLPYLSGKMLTIFRPIRYQDPLSLPFLLSLVFVTVMSCFLLAGSVCFLAPAGNEHFTDISLFCLLFICMKASVLILAQRATGARCLMACLRATMVLISTGACIAATFAMIAVMVSGAAGSPVFKTALAASVLTAVLLYLYKLTVTLFSTGISPFYCFLYLCTLEFIPISVLTVMLTRL